MTNFVLTGGIEAAAPKEIIGIGTVIATVIGIGTVTVIAGHEPLIMKSLRNVLSHET